MPRLQVEAALAAELNAVRAQGSALAGEARRLDGQLLKLADAEAHLQANLQDKQAGEEVRSTLTSSPWLACAGALWLLRQRRPACRRQEPMHCATSS